jgi:hypothetical protein
MKAPDTRDQFFLEFPPRVHKPVKALRGIGDGVESVEHRTVGGEKTARLSFAPEFAEACARLGGRKLKEAKHGYV